MDDSQGSSCLFPAAHSHPVHSGIAGCHAVSSYMFMLARRAFSQSIPSLFKGQEFLPASPEQISWFCLTSRQCPRVETALRARGSGPVQEDALRTPFLSRQCILGAQAWGRNRPRREELLTTMSPILGIMQVQTPDFTCSSLFLTGPPRGTTGTGSSLPWLAGVVTRLLQIPVRAPPP